MGTKWDAVKKFVLAALLRHGPMGTRLLASRVEEEETVIQEAVDQLRKDGLVEAVAGKNTKRYRVVSKTPPAP